MGEPPEEDYSLASATYVGVSVPLFADRILLHLKDEIKCGDMHVNFLTFA